MTEDKKNDKKKKISIDADGGGSGSGTALRIAMGKVYTEKEWEKKRKKVLKRKLP